MLHTLGRGLAPAAAAAFLLLLADGLSAENGRLLATEAGALFSLDIVIDPADLPLADEAGGLITAEDDRPLIAEAPAPLGLESVGDLTTETDQIIVTEQI